MSQLQSIKREISQAADPKRAKASAWFFKTGPGEYGEGDIFVGITVPHMRVIAKRHANLSFPEIATLLANPIHEYRFIALEILVMQYEHGTAKQKKAVVTFYCKHRRRINNWDLVDTSASYILGDYLLATDSALLDRYARSKNVWERRIAVVATFAFIRAKRFAEPKRIAMALLHDKHDLIHKAVGWMLREMGKQSQRELTTFLDAHYQTMPRTMLRYAIERLPASRRAHYLKRS